MNVSDFKDYKKYNPLSIKSVTGISLWLILFAIANMVQAQDTTKVLFIGNSHTFVNNLPQTFYQLATHAGKTVYVDDLTMGGYTFQMHLQNPATIQKINEKHWDFVILQEQSQIPSFIPERNFMMYPYAVSLDSIIHSNWLCTNTMFFMTWAHKYGDLGILQNGGSDSFENMQQRLRSGYLTIADSLDAAVAPCGWAWRKLIQDFPSIELFAADNYHPAENGTYLAACTFYASIFSQPAIGINYSGNVSASNAAIFQEVASQIVLDSLDLWNIGLYAPKPIANFGYFQNGNQFEFTDSSNLANNFEWDFGDGTSSTLQNPTHTYFAEGIYNVRLICRNSCDEDTIIKIIQYFVTRFNNNETTEFSISPNPFFDNISIKSASNKKINKIEITQLDGKPVYIIQADEKEINKLDLTKLNKGLYIMSIFTNNETTVTKIIKL
jgi:hypothetical protein